MSEPLSRREVFRFGVAGFVAGAAIDPPKAPAADPPVRFELPAAVLGVAEPEPEPGVGVGRGVDVRDAPFVAADGDRGGHASHADFPAGGREASAEDGAEGEAREVHAVMLRAGRGG